MSLNLKLCQGVLKNLKPDALEDLCGWFIKHEGDLYYAELQKDHARQAREIARLKKKAAMTPLTEETDADDAIAEIPWGDTTTTEGTTTTAQDAH
jgi:hypothetical protein